MYSVVFTDTTTLFRLEARHERSIHGYISRVGGLAPS